MATGHSQQEDIPTAVSSSPPRTMADLHRDWPDCGTCGHSLKWCEFCGEYADEHAPEACKDEDGAEYSFELAETWPVQTAHATREHPSEWEDVCPRCRPEERCEGCRRPVSACGCP